MAVCHSKETSFVSEKAECSKKQKAAEKHRMTIAWVTILIPILWPVSGLWFGISAQCSWQLDQGDAKKVPGTQHTQKVWPW